MKRRRPPLPFLRSFISSSAQRLHSFISPQGRLHWKKPLPKKWFFSGAGNRTWTYMKESSLEPESSASTNSAIPAFGARNGTWTHMMKSHAPQTCASTNSAILAYCVRNSCNDSIISYCFRFVNGFLKFFYFFRTEEKKKTMSGVRSSAWTILQLSSVADSIPLYHYFCLSTPHFQFPFPYSWLSDISFRNG